MQQNKRRDDDGPRIHHTEGKDTLRKHRNSVYDLLEDETLDPDIDVFDDEPDFEDSEEDWEQYKYTR